MISGWRGMRSTFSSFDCHFSFLYIQTEYCFRKIVRVFSWGNKLHSTGFKNSIFSGQISVSNLWSSSILLIKKLPSPTTKEWSLAHLYLFLSEVKIFFSYTHVTLDFFIPIPESRAVRTPHIIKSAAICMW